MAAFVPTSFRYDAHPTDTSAVICVTTINTKEISRTIVDQDLRDALDADGKLGAEMIPQTP
jgi:hypothetical protein